VVLHLLDQVVPEGQLVPQLCDFVLLTVENFLALVALLLDFDCAFFEALNVVEHDVAVDFAKGFRVRLVQTCVGALRVAVLGEASLVDLALRNQFIL
jgi:hypothetical protein